jgi:oligosaccharide repeat unit polymerase
MAELTIIVWFLQVITLFAGLRLAPCGLDGKHNLLSAHGLVLMMFFVFLILPATTPVFLSEYQLYWASAFSGPQNVLAGLFLVWASIAIFLASYRLFRHSPNVIPKSSENPPLGADPTTISVLFALVGLGILLKVLVVQIGGGIDMTIMRMSRGVAENMGISREGSGLILMVRSFSIVGDLAAVWLLVLAMARRRWRLAAFLLFIAMIAMTIGIIGKRLFVIWPLLAFALAFSHYVYKIRPKHILIVIAAIFLFGWLSLSFRIFAPLSAAGSLNSFDIRAVPWAQGSAWRFYFGSLEFAYFDLTVASINGREIVTKLFNGQLEMLYKTHIEPFFFIVPRAIWPSKPEQFLDLAHGLAALTFFEDVATVDLGINSALTGTSWLSGGVFGVVFAFGFLGYVAARSDKFYYSGKVSMMPSALRIIIYAYFLMVVFHLFRQGTFGWVFMIAVIQQLGGISAVVLLWFITFRASVIQNRTRRRKGIAV